MIRVLSFLILAGCGSRAPIAVELPPPALPGSSVITPIEQPMSPMHAFIGAGCKLDASQTMLDCKGARIPNIDECSGSLHVVPVTPKQGVALAECFVEQASMEGIRMSGCMSPSTVVIIAAASDGFEVITSRARLGAISGMVEKPHQATAIAVAMTGFEIFDHATMPPSNMIVHQPGPQLTRVTGDVDGQSFDVRLFTYQTCGCSHPTWAIDLRVTREGAVSEIKRAEIWEDSKTRGLCVD